MTDTMVYTLSLVALLLIVLGLLRLRHVSVPNLVLGLMGTVTGLILGALASVPLSKLPQPLGSTAPIVATIAITLILIGIIFSRRMSLLALMPFLTAKPEAPLAIPEVSSDSMPPILVDTSVIIDGRIADIAAAGFVPGRLSVPRFVLAELQNIADSEDAMRRGRGRRGLDVLNQLREMPDVDVEIIEEDVSGIKEVDAKLVALAQKLGCHVLTTDYNLNRVAQIQGVRVLNVNELSNAIRPVVLPGEELIVRVVQPGKERNQGVGYLADGTMIVVENGDKLMGQEVATEVTRVFQTVAGKMIFATPRHKPVPQTTPAPAPVDAVAEAQKKPDPVTADTQAAEQQAKPKNRSSRFKKRPDNRGDHREQAGRPQRTADIESRIIAAAAQTDPPTRQQGNL